VGFMLPWAGVTPAPNVKTKEVSCWRLCRQQREISPKQVLTGTKSRIFLNSKVQGLTLPKEA